MWGTPSLRPCDLQDSGPRLPLGRQWVSWEKGVSLPAGACRAAAGVWSPGVTTPRPLSASALTRITETRLVRGLQERAPRPARVRPAVPRVVTVKEGRREGEDSYVSWRCLK